MLMTVTIKSIAHLSSNHLQNIFKSECTIMFKSNILGNGAGALTFLGLGGTVCVGESGSSLGDTIPLVIRLKKTSVKNFVSNHNKIFYHYV